MANFSHVDVIHAVLPYLGKSWQGHADELKINDKTLITLRYLTYYYENEYAVFYRGFASNGNGDIEFINYEFTNSGLHLSRKSLNSFTSINELEQFLIQQRTIIHKYVEYRHTAELLSEIERL